jgi:hypothetical protein
MKREFYPNGNIIENGWPDLRNKNIKWGNTSLRMKYKYRQGHFLTMKNNAVEALEFVPDSLEVELFEKKFGFVVHKEESFFDQFEFDLSYNCFGYCFADSKLWILDPTQIILDEYEQVEPNNAEIILFKEYHGIDDLGQDIYIFSHAVKVLENGNVSFKPGLNKLIQDVPRKKAIHTYNYNHEIYIRKKGN